MGPPEMTEERLLLYASDKQTMQDGRSRCRVCKKRISHWGAARYNHAAMHERRGEARIELNPNSLSSRFWTFYVIHKEEAKAK